MSKSINTTVDYFNIGESIKVYADKDSASKYVADRIANLIATKQVKGERAILGLATGSTPKGVYKELVRLHKDEGLSFANVVTFNLDEYYPMHPIEDQSYVSFMKANLFDHIDVVKSNIHIPDGTLSLEAIEAFCQSYEQKIKDFGGLDLQLLGIGRSGHIGFNEPGSDHRSMTRLVSLDEITRLDAVDDFKGYDKVPTQAITMGIKTIIEAKQVILMALTQRKAQIMHRAIYGEVSKEVPATFLQKLTHVEYILDNQAAELLK
ncbi:glucosamine-6-phosphate deaminase [Myroides pelagicus]|uniref:Glucosamine-6-phosphate deaminase n=1 Tax=Myroides pelagicus TaxID=270914 RepID=A0A7K1GPJ8_9FLAO|nr:glucosamine-6-phosphate deaminase [Myroides pelagicus]MTH30771.1 glucosamine-6-phosphate deaminase [Myroides pelagicus]